MRELTTLELDAVSGGWMKEQKSSPIIASFNNGSFNGNFNGGSFNGVANGSFGVSISVGNNFDGF